MAVTVLQIAAAYDRPYRTTCRHIKELQEKKLFEKKSPGKQFNADEVRKLETLMQFKFYKMD